jgi:hypothetical protein
LYFVPGREVVGVFVAFSVRRFVKSLRFERVASSETLSVAFLGLFGRPVALAYACWFSTDKSNGGRVGKTPMLHSARQLICKKCKKYFQSTTFPPNGRARGDSKMSF